MTGGKRLIEVDFPLQQVSIDSVHEKSVRHGHISTLHIWPARRPLAACRAALAATLLPDPQNAEQRQAIYQRLAGKVQQKVETRQVDGKTVQISKPETVGGILHWGREQGAGLDWFRQEIRKAYGGRAPKVLDPFAGGGAIPLEAMRLGCDVTAVDINPVAWFILKCTLEYPQRFAGKTLPLPDFALRDRSFMTAFFKAKGYKGKQLQRQLDKLGGDGKAQDKEPGLFSAETPLDADLAWQIRAWGLWVHAEARKQLAPRYPTYAEFQPLAPGGKPFKAQDLQRLKPDEHGNTNAAPLNIDFDAEYLANPQNPRWVQKTTGAYLWARTVRCKSCRATVPLLKTCWLAKRPSKRVLLTITPKADGTGVDFGIEKDVPREQEARGAGTMSRSGVQCPCCSAIMTMEDIQLENRAGKVGAALTAVCVQGVQSKEYRLPTQHEVSAAAVSAEEVSSAFEKLPFGCIVEKISTPGAGASRALSVPTHGLDTWAKLFTDRQLVALATLACTIHSFHDAMEADSIPTEWSEAIVAGLACALNKSADYGSQITTWGNTREGIGHTFARFALPMTWDFAEGNPIADVSGAFSHAVEWVGRVYDHTLASFTTAQKPKVVR